MSLAISLLVALVSGWSGSVFAAEHASDAKARYTISDFNSPFQFYYQAWSDKIQVVNGHVLLKSLSCRGGAGVNKAYDLSSYANLTPAFRLQTTPANTAKTLQLQLLDAGGRNATWHFPLPQPSADFVTVIPTDAVAISHPHALERADKPDDVGALDLAKICQFKVQGDWQKGVVDLELDAIVLVEPDATMLAQREAYTKVEAEAAALKAKRLAEAKEKLAREREIKLRAYSYRGDRSPEVTHVSLVAPDILSLTIEAQRTIPSTMTKYEPQPGDEKKEEKSDDGKVRQVTLLRNGQRIGRLQGKNFDWLFTDERLDDDPLLDFITETPANYTIQSSDDPNYANAVKPIAVYRKSVPRDVVLPGGQHPTRHRIYLRLPSNVQADKTYSIKVAAVNVKNGDLLFKADLQRVRSESVHVNQIGYRPDDPVKRAFLSIWLGTGGAYTFADGLGFSLIEEGTNKTVFSGKVERALAADGKEQLWTKPPKNYSSTAIYRMDFSAYNTPGTYRLYVEGIGCSYPFEISRSAWEKAFLTQMKGLYNQRSGVELGPPYTDFKKPRDFHPDDGAVVTRSTYDVLSKGGPYAYADMAKGDTGEVVKDAWGGYHDAGDWNPRRVTHMYTTLAQLELCELYPDYFSKLKLNIPAVDGVPDMIAEALFEIDCFRRLQMPNGAVPHGIETEGDPSAGEVSWLSTQHCYVLAPNIRDTWLYAAVAGRAAKVLKPFKPELAQTYLDSAIRAFKWAEGEFSRKRAAGEAMEKKDYWDALDARNLSALVLYDMTGDKAYHEVFLEDTCLKQPGAEIAAWGWNIQCDQVFLYARMDAAKTDPKLRENARSGVISLAERSLKYAAGNAFNITQREPGRPMFAGFFSTSGGSEPVRAHYLTGRLEYLKGAVQSCQFQAGCNPNNLVYTTGLGANPVKVPLELDARSSGQAVPIGLTVFGNSDYFNWRNSFWDINLRFVNRPEFIWPDAYSWPLTEAYFDVWVLVSANEYVIDTWAPNVLVWGYLSARPDLVK
ncbi:MAG: glycoside hydrolase family 9 protein [Thermoguttaceae bacterium]